MESSIPEQEVKKTLGQIRQELQSLANGGDLSGSTSKIVGWYTQPCNKQVKLLVYPLVKALAELDHSLIYSTLGADFSSGDPELQLNAVKLLYCLPTLLAIRFLREFEKELQELVASP